MAERLKIKLPYLTYVKYFLHFNSYQLIYKLLKTISIIMICVWPGYYTMKRRLTEPVCGSGSTCSSSYLRFQVHGYNNLKRRKLLLRLTSLLCYFYAAPDLVKKKNIFSNVFIKIHRIIFFKEDLEKGRKKTFFPGNN